MKLKLYIYIVFLFSLLQCDLKAQSINEAFGCQWANHSIDFYNDVVIDSTCTFHTLLLRTLGVKKGTIHSLLPISQIKSTDANILV